MLLPRLLLTLASALVISVSGIAATAPNDTESAAIAEVEKFHADWREVAASDGFKAWLAIQPKEVQRLVAESWNSKDVIRVLDLYKRDVAKLEPIVGTFEEGWTANERGDYSKALRIWRPLADRGDDWAQYNVGVIYQHGRGVPKDEVRAVYWYNKAAVRGNVTAQQGLYRMYRSGTGAPKDDVKATYWLRKAADGGQVDAQFLLADKYDKGEDVPKSSSEAAYWWRKAAEQGHALAQYELASSL